MTQGVSLSGLTAIAGAPFRDDKGTHSGAAYILGLHIDDKPPVVLDVMASPNPVAHATPFGVTATVDDTTTGGSSISSASYTLNGGGATAMAAGVELTFVANVGFDGVTAAALADLTFLAEPVDLPFTANDTVVVRTDGGALHRAVASSRQSVALLRRCGV